jgi:hypothetical protein
MAVLTFRQSEPESDPRPGAASQSIEPGSVFAAQRQRADTEVARPGLEAARQKSRGSDRSFASPKPENLLFFNRD